MCEYEMFKYIQVLPLVFPRLFVSPGPQPCSRHPPCCLGLSWLPLIEGGVSLSQLTQSWASHSGLLAVAVFLKLMTPPTPPHTYTSLALLQDVITVIGGA